MKRYLCLLAVGIGGVALAQQSQLPPFEQADSNSDGQISRTEAAQLEGLDFDRADTNQDGHLSRTEYMAAAQQGGAGGAQPGQPGAGQGAQPGQPGAQPPSSGAQPGQPGQPGQNPGGVQ
ncbi:MAG TPA: hypothetical protein VFV10_07495 [Gammaproteobacteria bacterium]|nr:hypothetical protein [Gammaproteobacteria bacterium]